MQINRKDFRAKSWLLTCSPPLYFQNEMEATDDRGFRDNGRKQFRRRRLPASVQRQHRDHPRASCRRTLLAVSQRARVTRERILLSAIIGGSDPTETATLSPVSAHDPGGAE